MRVAEDANAREARWQALGSTVVLRVVGADVDDGALEHARALVATELAALDGACSRFRADSELVALNASAGRRTRVSPLLFEALTVALRAAELTGGDVDPTLGRALELCGYDRDWRLLGSDAPVPGRPVPHPAGAVRARYRGGWQTVEVQERTRSVRLARGIALDLGATAKAWACDRAAQAAHAACGCGVLVSIGGDIATAGPAPLAGWPIRVTDDHRSEPSAPGQTVLVHSGGLATSSTAVRRWRRGPETMHHIIDPDTGLPAREHWRTVSVTAADCTDANIAATACIVRGAGAADWLARLALPARLVPWSGPVANLAGWPA